MLLNLKYCTYLICLSTFLLGVSCKENKKDIKNTNVIHQNIYQDDNSQNSKQINMNIEEAKTFTFNKFKLKYGEPKIQENFKIDKALSEFRIELYNQYTKKQYTNEEIIIKEATWSFNQEYNLTIWYERQQTSWQPVDLSKWLKGTVF